MNLLYQVVPGGQAGRAGLRANDKVLKINHKEPRDVNDAVNLVKKAGINLILTIERSDENGSGQFSRSAV
jgi:C-terminal processing protease CtpA/Prc